MPTTPSLAVCSLCGRRPPAPSCPRCELRAFADLGLAPPDPPEVRAGHAAAALARQIRRARWESLAATHGCVRVALVGCGRAKRPGRHPARRLYTGALFRAALSHAERTADEVFVLSAKHGLVELDDVVDAYDVRLSSRDEERKRWGRLVECSLRLLFVGIPLAVAVYAGAAYADAFERAARHNRWRIDQPLRGLGVGQRLRWFADRRNARRSGQLAFDL